MSEHMNESLSDELLRLDRQLCFPLYACSRKVVNLYTPFLKPLGITYTQYIVMLVLWEKDNIKVGTLCERLYLDNGTVTPLLKKLEEKGYIHRERDTVDERVVYIKLTDAGRKLKEQAREIPVKVGSCLSLTQEEAAQLYTILYQVMNQKTE